VAVGAQAQNVVAAVIDAGISRGAASAPVGSMSISEPTGVVGDAYYDAYVLPATIIPAGAETKLSITRDVPIDQQRAINAATATDFVALRQNGTTANFRVVHLQRLAKSASSMGYRSESVPYNRHHVGGFDGIQWRRVPKPVADPNVTSVSSGLASLQLGDNDPAIASVPNNIWRREIPNGGAIPTSNTLSSQVFPYFFTDHAGLLEQVRRRDAAD